MADALGTPGGVVSDEDHRIALAGLIAPQTSSLAVRTGVLAAPGSTNLVTGTSTTGTMTYAIAAHHSVTTRGVADGVYLGPNLEAATTVATTAAPGANSRIDIIWEKQNDLGSTITPDTGTTAPLYGVAQGTAAASPTAPAIPVGAMEIARATVAAGATSTNGAGVTITNTARQTVARGGIFPVTAADVTAGAYVDQYRGHPTNGLERWDGTRWGTPTLLGRWTDIDGGAAYGFGITSAAVNAPMPGGGDTRSVTVPVGRQLEVELAYPRVVLPSAGTVSLQFLVGTVQVDGAEISAAGALTVPLKLHGFADGDGGAMNIRLVTWQPVGAGASLAGAPGSGGSVRLRYRIN